MGVAREFKNQSGMNLPASYRNKSPIPESAHRPCGVDRIMTPDDIRRLNMKDALDQCSGLNDADLGQLIDNCAPTDHRVLFALKVARQWVLPTDLNIGLAP